MNKLNKHLLELNNNLELNVMKDHIIKVKDTINKKLDDYNNIYNLSETKDFKEAAVNLFKFLRLADDSDSEIIICSELPDVDLGRAINDRLKRAAR